VPGSIRAIRCETPNIVGVPTPPKLSLHPYGRGTSVTSSCNSSNAPGSATQQRMLPRGLWRACIVVVAAIVGAAPALIVAGSIGASASVVTPKVNVAFEAFESGGLFYPPPRLKRRPVALPNETGMEDIVLAPQVIDGWLTNIDWATWGARRATGSGLVHVLRGTLAPRVLPVPVVLDLPIETREGVVFSRLALPSISRQHFDILGALAPHVVR